MTSCPETNALCEFSECSTKLCALKEFRLLKAVGEHQVPDVMLGIYDTSVPLTATEVRAQQIRAMRGITIIESPFAGDIPRNLRYLQACLHNSLVVRGETPFASHGFFPGFLNEHNPEERRLGIDAGFRFWPFARLIAFYLDLGTSPGMAAALSRARSMDFKIDFRHLPGFKEFL